MDADSSIGQIDQSTASLTDNNWLARLHKLQSWIVLGYAVSLPVSMTVSWILLILGIVLVLIDLISSEQSRQLLKQRAPLLIPLGVMSMTIAASGFHHGGIKEAARCVWSLKAISCYFLASLTFSREPSLATRCLSALLVVSAAAGVFGAIQQVFNFHPFGFHYLQATGFLGGPMAFAGQMQIFALLALALAITGGYEHCSGRLASKGTYATVVLCNWLGVLFCAERSAWFGAAAALLVCAAFISFKMFRRTVVALVVIGATLWFCVPVVQTRLQATLDLRHDVSTQARLTIWRKAVLEWQREPIFGVGFLNFPHLDIKEAELPGRSKELNHAHSNYLHMLATSGALGLSAYLYLLASCLFLSKRLWQNGKCHSNKFVAGVGIGLFATTVALAASGLFEYNFGTAQVRLAQWFVFGLLALSAWPIPKSNPN
jgi:O-antigen ligase